MNLQQTILETLQSVNVSDSNGEPANVVDVVQRLAVAAQRIAEAIYPPGTSPGEDAAGVHVSSLVEAVGGVTAGLVQIAAAICDLAEAVRESRS